MDNMCVQKYLYFPFVQSFSRRAVLGWSIESIKIMNQIRWQIHKQLELGLPFQFCLGIELEQQWYNDE